MEPTSIGRVGGHGSGPGCGPKPSSISIADDAGQRRRGRADGEVHDALAGQARDRRAADVLHDDVGPLLADERADGIGDLDGSRVPLDDRGGQADVRTDRRLTHRPSVDCGPCARSSGRRTLEVDVG